MISDRLDCYALGHLLSLLVDVYAHVPAGSYKHILLVQAHQVGSANDQIYFPQVQITAI